MRLALAISILLTTIALSAAELPTPAAPDSAEPHLAAGHDGSLIMSWIEPGAGKKHAVRFATWKAGRWSQPRTIVERDDLFVNWADFPSVVADAKGNLFAHWLQKSGEATYAYDIMLSISRDGGATWTRPRKLHDDDTKSEHGFVSLVPAGREGIAAAWLDGREMKGDHDHGGGGSMTLRYAEVAPDGTISRRALLDNRVCECCATGMTIGPAGPVVVYRDRSEQEVRDIGYVRRAGGRWTSPRIVHADGWKIEGCPVNGPQIDSRGNRIVTAWFSGAETKARVFAAFSSNGGVSFSKPLQIDGGSPVGRLDVVLLTPETAAVAWIERTGGNAQVVVRRVGADGKLGPIVRVGDSSSARSAGFPRMSVVGGDLFVAWTEPSTPKRIRLAKIDFPR